MLGIPRAHKSGPLEETRFTAATHHVVEHPENGVRLRIGLTVNLNKCGCLTEDDFYGGAQRCQARHPDNTLIQCCLPLGHDIIEGEEVHKFCQMGSPCSWHHNIVLWTFDQDRSLLLSPPPSSSFDTNTL